MPHDPDWPVPPGEPTPEPPLPPTPEPPGIPAPAPQPRTAADRWRRVPVVPAVIAGIVLLAACGLGAYLLVRDDAPQPATPTEETRIRGLVEDFAAAVDQQDQPAILDLLCAEEAEEFRADDFEPSPEPLAEPPSVRPVTAVDIRVMGETASAEVSRPGQRDVTLYFRKERGTWKVCAPVGDAITPSASAAPSN